MYINSYKDPQNSLNLPEICWNTHQVLETYQNSSKNSQKLLLTPPHNTLKDILTILETPWNSQKLPETY